MVGDSRISAALRQSCSKVYLASGYVSTSNPLSSWRLKLSTALTQRSVESFSDENDAL